MVFGHIGHPHSQPPDKAPPPIELSIPYPWIAPSRRPSSPVTPHPYIVMPIIPTYPELPVMISTLIEAIKQPIMGLYTADRVDAALWMDCIRSGLSGFIDQDGHIISQHPQYGLTTRHKAHHLAALYTHGKAHQDRHLLCQEWLPHLTRNPSIPIPDQWIAQLPIRIVIICDYPPESLIQTHRLNVTYFAHSSLGNAMDQLFNEPIDMVMLPSCTDHFWAHHTAHLIHDFFPDTELLLVDQQPDPELLLTFLCNGGRGHVSGWHDTPGIEKWITEYAYFQWALHCIRTDSLPLQSPPMVARTPLQAP